MDLETRVEIELRAHGTPTYTQSFGVPEATTPGIDAPDEILEPSIGATR